ncbi:phenylacetate 2-hydroxylase [Aspergillus lentulus]|nr:phenylacetate 2-hydroxylase [Aspergillus lentulus]
MHTANPEMACIQTDIEEAKLARRQTEYAVLRDALRRGIPVAHIPFLVAAASARAVPFQSADARMCEDKVYPHLRGGYRVSVPVPVSEGAPSIRQRQRQSEHGAQPVVYRRVQLDDSFLRRAYKRRWGRARAGLGAAMSTSVSVSTCPPASASSGQVYFHHWVPGGKKTRTYR